MSFLLALAQAAAPAADPTTRQLRAISNLHPLDWSVNFNQDLPRYNASVGFDLFGGFQQRSYRFNLKEFG